MRIIAILLFISVASFSQHLTPRTIWSASNTNGRVGTNRLSRDGRILAFIGSGGNANRITVRDLGTGRTRFVLVQGECSSIPLSGSGIVYLCNTPDEEQVLHVVGNDGSHRERYRKKAPYGDLLHATADESRVLAIFRSSTGAELVLIGVRDGSHQVLLSDGTLVSCPRNK